MNESEIFNAAIKLKFDVRVKYLIGTLKTRRQARGEKKDNGGQHCGS